MIHLCKYKLGSYYNLSKFTMLAFSKVPEIHRTPARFKCRAIVMFNSTRSKKLHNYLLLETSST